MESNKILIICFTFPPQPGIGGRRWAKFSKYLLRDGYDIQVLACDFVGKGNSEWSKDIAQLEAEHRIHRFKSGYPVVLREPPETIFGKILYRVFLYILRFKYRGNLYDKSVGCRPHLLKMAKHFVTKGYSTIVISAGPFTYTHYLLGLKKEFPDLKMIFDIRDPWTNNKTAFGYWALNPERMKYEKQMESEVAKGYDKILTVADDIGRYFIETYAVPPENVMTLHNGYDVDDFPEIKKVQNKRKQLVFTGNLYEKARESFDMLLTQLKQMKSENHTFLQNFECHFYGEIHPSFKSVFDDDLNLYYHGKVPLKEVYTIISNATACFLFLTDDLNYSFSTKFFEYIAFRKPVIVFSKPGKTGLFVEMNKMGKQAGANNFKDIVESIENGQFYPPECDTSEFGIKALSEKLKNFLK